MEEPGRDDGHLVVDALEVQRLFEVDPDWACLLLVLAVAELPEEATPEGPDVAGICKTRNNLLVLTLKGK